MKTIIIITIITTTIILVEKINSVGHLEPPVAKAKTPTSTK